MKKLLLIPMILFIAACGDNEAKNEKNANEVMNEEEAIMKHSFPDELCYLMTEGSNNEDSNIIHLKFNGNNVTGEMKLLPWQKDASVGIIQGTKTGDIINLEWIYFQEGMKYTEPVVLKMYDNKVMQKATEVNDNGETIIPEGAGFVRSYKKVDCSVLPERDY